jgi:hypothetical protein
MIFLLILMFGALGLVDVPQLVKGRRWWELAVYAVLMALAFTLILLRALDVDVPNPVKDTQYVVKWVFEQMHLTYD